MILRSSLKPPVPCARRNCTTMPVLSGEQVDKKEYWFLEAMHGLAEDNREGIIITCLRWEKQAQYKLLICKTMGGSRAISIQVRQS